MQRLVYSPKVYAYIKTDATRKKSPDSYIDLSDFISSGSVNRVTKAASTFTLTLRNPYRIWTQPDPATAPLYESQIPAMPQILQNPFEPVFHPMDTITIWGSRFKNRPIQLFTGFLDSSPYLQLYPGAVTLTGSCTLKRLLYTYWDPGLTAIIKWLAQYGWIANAQTGSVTNQGAATSALTQKNNYNLNDGSVANLVYGLLHDIGNWDDDEILIEGLPSNIVQSVNAIYKIIQQDNSLADTELQTFLQTALGVGSYGSGSGGGSTAGAGGGTASGPVAGAKQIVQHVEPIAAKYNVPLLMVLATMYIETSFTDVDTPGSKYTGWFQCQPGGCYAYGPWATGGYTVADTHDLGLSCNAFCAAAAGWAKAQPGITSDIQQWAMSTQGVNCGNNPRYCDQWSNALATSQSYINQFASSSGASTTPQTGNPTSTTTTKKGKNQPSGVTGTYVSPFSQCNASTTGPYTRTDQGVDFTFGTMGQNILAIGNGKVLGTSLPGWGPNPGGGPGGLAPGGFMWYQLTDGPNQGAIVYMAEGITTTVSTGDTISVGQAIAVTAGAGIEIGYAVADGNTLYYATSHVPYNNAGPTAEGIRFARFLRSLGVNTADDPGAGDASYAGNGSLTTDGKVNGSLSGQATLTGSSGSGASGSPGSTGGVADAATAAAFAVSLALPGLANQEAAALLVGEKSLMNCTPIFPFVQQVTGASLRDFQSLPDGTFFAFFPDYFGEFAKMDGNPGAYWSVPDIEIISGQIQLSDDALATHVYVVGDTIGSFGQGTDSELINEIMSGGVMTIFEAFESGFVNLGTGANAQLTGKIDAINFLKKYGARPYINEDASFIRNPQFEAFMAFQTFQLMWARQFQTNFSFTFMPEMYPGGRIELSDHGFQVYVDSVTHNFDYISGFTTDAQLEAPSVMAGVTDNVGVSKGLIRNDLITVTTLAGPTTPASTSKARGGQKK
jgi:hypothetical protein